MERFQQTSILVASIVIVAGCSDIQIAGGMWAHSGDVGSSRDALTATISFVETRTIPEGSIWIYDVAAGGKPALSHFSFSLPTCYTVLDAGTIDANGGRHSGQYEMITYDPSKPNLPVTGIKFDTDSYGHVDNETLRYYFTLAQTPLADGISFEIKGGLEHALGNVTGPVSTCTNDPVDPGDIDNEINCGPMLRDPAKISWRGADRDELFKIKAYFVACVPVDVDANGIRVVLRHPSRPIFEVDVPELTPIRAAVTWSFAQPSPGKRKVNVKKKQELCDANGDIIAIAYQFGVMAEVSADVDPDSPIVTEVHIGNVMNNIDAAWEGTVGKSILMPKDKFIATLDETLPGVVTQPCVDGATWSPAALARLGAS